MEIFNGLINVILVIVLLVVSFVFGAITGFAGLYLAIQKYCPEAAMLLDDMAHSNNKRRLEREIKDDKEDKEN